MRKLSIVPVFLVEALVFNDHLKLAAFHSTVEQYDNLPVTLKGCCDISFSTHVHTSPHLTPVLTSHTITRSFYSTRFPICMRFPSCMKERITKGIKNRMLIVAK